MSAGKWLQKRSWMFGAGAIVVLLLAVLVMRGTWFSTAEREIAFSDFFRAVEAGNVQQVALGEQALSVRLRGGERVRTIPPAGYVSGNPAFVSDLVRRRIRVIVLQPISESGAFSFGATLLALGFFGLVGFTIYRVTAGRIPSLESRARRR